MAQDNLNLKFNISVAGNAKKQVDALNKSLSASESNARKLASRLGSFTIKLNEKSIENQLKGISRNLGKTSPLKLNVAIDEKKLTTQLSKIAKSKVTLNLNKRDIEKLLKKDPPTLKFKYDFSNLAKEAKKVKLPNLNQIKAMTELEAVRLQTLKITALGSNYAKYNQMAIRAKYNNSVANRQNAEHFARTEETMNSWRTSLAYKNYIDNMGSSRKNFGGNGFFERTRAVMEDAAFRYLSPTSTALNSIIRGTAKDHVRDKYLKNTSVYNTLTKNIPDIKLKDVFRRLKALDFSSITDYAGSKIGRAKKLSDIHKDPKLIEQGMNEIAKDPAKMMSIAKAGAGLTSAVIAFGAAAKKTAEIVKQSINDFSQIESLRTQLGVVYGSQAEANSQFNELEAYAKKSPFGVEMMTQQAILLKQSGVYQSDLMDTLKRIGDISSGNAEKMRSVSETYARIMSSTTVTARDMRQLATAGIPSYKALSQATGINQNLLRSRIQAGKVSSEDFTKMLKVLTDKGGTFYGATEVGAKTILARKQNLEDSKQMAYASLGEWVTNIGNKGDGNSIFSNMLEVQESIYQKVEDIFKEKNNEKKKKNNTEEKLDKITSKQGLLEMGDVGVALYKSLGGDDIKQRNLDYIEASASLYEQALNNITSEKTFLSNEQKLALDDIINPFNRQNNESKWWDSNKSDLFDVRDYNEEYKQTYQLLQTALEKGFVTEKNLRYLFKNSYADIDIDKDKNITEEDKQNFRILQFSKSLQNATDSINKFADTTDGIQTLIGKERERFNQSAIGKVRSEDEDYFTKMEKRNRAEYLSKKYFGGEANPSLRNASLDDIYDTYKYLTNGSNVSNLSLENLKDENGKITEEAKLEWKELGKKTRQFMNNILNSGDLKNNEEYIVGRQIKRILKILEEGDVNEESVASLQEQIETSKGILKNSKIDSSIVSKILDILNITLSNPNWEPNEYKNIGRRGEARKWEELLGGLTGVSVNRIASENENSPGKGTRAALDYYKKVQSSVNVSKALAASLMSSGILSVRELGEFQKQASTGKTDDSGNEIFKYEQIKNSLVEKAEKSGHAGRQALSSIYQNELSTIDNFVTTGAFTPEDADKMHSIASNLGMSLSFAADASGKFTEQTARAIMELRDELAVRKNINNLALNKAKINKEQKESASNLSISRSILGLPYITSNFAAEYNLRKRIAQENIATASTWSETKEQNLPNWQAKEAYATLTGEKKDVYTQKEIGNFAKEIDSLSPEKASALIKLLDVLAEASGEMSTKELVKANADNIKNEGLVKVSEASLQSFEDNAKKQAAIISGTDRSTGLALKTTIYNSDTEKQRNLQMGLPENILPSERKKYINEHYGEYESIMANSGVRSSVARFLQNNKDKVVEEFKKGKNKDGQNLNTNFGDIFDFNFSRMFDESGLVEGKEAVAALAENLKMIENSNLKSLSFEGLAVSATDATNRTIKLTEITDNLKVGLKETFQNSAVQGYATLTKTIGENLYGMAANSEDMDDSNERFSKALAGINAQLLDQTGTLMTNAGLSMVANAGNDKAQIAQGLALAAAGGVANIISGILGESASNTNSDDDDALERLESLRDNLKELLAQARNDAEYYETELSSRKALAANTALTSTKVNDMIITPQGNFSTAPDDYIMAMKKPDSLAGNNGVSVNFNLIDQSGEHLNITDQSVERNGDSLDISVVVNSLVKQSINNGEYDNTFSAMAQRQQGKVVFA